MTMRLKEQDINVQYQDSWAFEFHIKTLDARGMKTLPWDLNSRFVSMYITDVTGGAVASGTVAGSADVVANASAGIALISFETTATSGVMPGLYHYETYILDFPYITSAFYKKRIMNGSFQVSE